VTNDHRSGENKRTEKGRKTIRQLKRGRQSTSEMRLECPACTTERLLIRRRYGAKHYERDAEGQKVVHGRGRGLRDIVTEINETGALKASDGSAVRTVMGPYTMKDKMNR